MKTFWRISNHCDLAGMGGERSNGRWHIARRGKRIVYLSEHPALALIEVLANLNGSPELFPRRYQLMKVRVADGASAGVLPVESLSSSWRSGVAETQAAGDTWLDGGHSALLSVPSAPAPESFNCLFNPLHADSKDVGIEWCKWMEYDRRLFHV